MVGVEDQYAAFCLDEAIIHWGQSLEAELERVADKAKTARAAEGAQKLTLEKWLKTGAYAEKKEESEAQPTKKAGFRNPTATK